MPLAWYGSGSRRFSASYQAAPQQRRPPDPLVGRPERAPPRVAGPLLLLADLARRGQRPVREEQAQRNRPPRRRFRSRSWSGKKEKRSPVAARRASCGIAERRREDPDVPERSRSSGSRVERRNIRAVKPCGTTRAGVTPLMCGSGPDPLAPSPASGSGGGGDGPSSGRATGSPASPLPRPQP